jgi:transcriptional regulator PpsR
LPPPKASAPAARPVKNSSSAKSSGASAGSAAVSVKAFEGSGNTLGNLNASDAATLIAAAADVALIVDHEGIIRDVAFGSDELSSEGYAKWLGQHWVDTVTVESRPKVEALLRDAAANVAPKNRRVNHTSSRGADVPILYSAVQVGGKDQVVAIGRDLRGIAALQRRLVEAQQSMERDYWRLRQVETRYRLLFQMASEPVLILDATTEKVAEANPAAAQLFGETAASIVGRMFLDCFDKDSAPAVVALLAGARSAGRANDVEIRLADGKTSFALTGTLFRQEKASFFLIQFMPPEGEGVRVALPKTKVNLIKLVENAPDAFVATDLEGKVLAANAAFVELAQLVNVDQARDESLERWLGRPGVDLAVLIANLRQHGSVRLFATTICGEHGATAEVEISAVSVPTGEQPCFGFTIRNVGRRLANDGAVAKELPRSVAQLTELVGRVPLKEIVRETTDLIERLCIEAALELTHDNRASAAEMLGLSRQSLYVKLHRYGLGDLTSDKVE